MKYRILFLADIDSSHTRKWAVSLSERGYAIGIFSLRKSTLNWAENYPAIQVFHSDGFSKEKFTSGDAGKVSYLKMSGTVRRVISEFNPDILHAHYATSYGLLGARSGFHPFVISVWGSDVFEFPKKSWFHRTLLKRNLRKADAVFSTSTVMKEEVIKLGVNNVHVTPFGVDVDVYKPLKAEKRFGSNRVIGTIKSLEYQYGIDVLIRAFDELKKSYKEPLKLVICGSGTQESTLKELAAKLKSGKDILFTGSIPQDEVPEYLNQFDIFANLSRQESFGVSVIEAMSGGIPVVVSNAPGLKEVTNNGVVGLMVPVESVAAAAGAMASLLNNSARCHELSALGRQWVEQNYNWKKNLDHITELYEQIIANHRRA